MTAHEWNPSEHYANRMACRRCGREAMWNKGHNVRLAPAGDHGVAVFVPLEEDCDEAMAAAVLES